MSSLSATTRRTVPALVEGRRIVARSELKRTPAPIVIAGDAPVELAAVTAWAVVESHAVILKPRSVRARFAGTSVHVTSTGIAVDDRAGAEPPAGWHVAMYTSGST